VISALNEFPKEFDLDDFVERLIVIEKIDAGLHDVKTGETVSHTEVKQMVKKWRK
jgi:predicted transcriptional regulator